jgi:syntaxin 5
LSEQTDADFIDSADGQRSTVTVTMTARDRTSEFTNAIRSMQSRNAARASSASQQNPRRARHIQSYSQFMMIAKNIGKNIASTYTKLEKLALCKSSMYRIAYANVHH